ncbi:Protein-kinase-like protein [Globisporangium polare]
MSLLREERSALPAIGEDTKTQAEMCALLDALHDDSNSLPPGVQESLDMLLPRIHIRPAVRKRFHSSDLVHSNRFSSSGYGSSTLSNGNGGVHSPYSSSSTTGGVVFVDSPTELRRWLLTRGAVGNMNNNGVSNPQLADPDMSELRRYRAQRRTLSETYTRFISFDTLGPIEASHYDDDDDDSEIIDARSRDDELKRLLNKSRRTSDDYSVSSASSMYSSPATTPHSRSFSFATPEHENSGSSVGGSDGESLEKLRNLQKLYQEGFITVTEYKDRRLQLVDELSIPQRTIAKATDLIMTDLPIVYREPPDFTLLRERDAIKHIFDSEQRKWTSSRIKVKLDTQPFARGGLRQVFHMQDLSATASSKSGTESYVAKVAINPHENPDTYFRDVEMQAVASKFAKLYNSYNPPRRVEFLEAWILQLMPPSGDDDPSEMTLSGTICGVEPFIAGEYHKHNNNFGFVSDFERNTPQAFSHFTYEASGHQILVVDIQGVGDHYTDPQIHTCRGKEFGKGNLALRGFERFLESHRCNLICRYLKLPLNNPKDDEPLSGVNGESGGPVDPKGTVPAQPFMSQPRVRVDRVDSELCHYYGDSTAFKSYKAKKDRAMQQQQQQQAMMMGFESAEQQQHNSGGAGGIQSFVAGLKTQRNCSAWCGISSCGVS